MKMSYEEVRGSAAKFSAQSDNVQQIIDTMYSELNNLKSGWDGNAASAFEAKLNELKPHFQKAQELISEISGALSKSASVMEQAETDVANAFR